MISKINSVNLPVNQGVNSNKVSQLPAAKPDSFAEKEFNYDDAIATLKNIKTTIRGNSVEKFKESELETIGNELKRDSNKWNSIKTLALAKGVNSYTVAKLAQHPADKLDAALPFALATTGRYEHSKYDSSELDYFMENSTAKQIKAAAPLSKTNLSMANISEIIASSKLENKFEKIAQEVLNLEKQAGEDLYSVSLTKNEYNPNEFKIQAVNDNNEDYSAFYDGKFNRYAVASSKIESEDGEYTYKINKAKDFRTNTESKVRIKSAFGQSDTVTHEIRIVKDKNGKVQRTEYTTPSEVKGVFNIVQKTPDGKEKIISSGKINPKTGITTIKKDMESLDGTRTTVLYEDDPQGNRISEYKIVDKNGKVLLNNNCTFEVVSENKFISSKNGKKYEITVDEKEINVKSDKTEAKISIDSKIQGDRNAIMKALKAMPGEELIKLSNSVETLQGVEDSTMAGFDASEKWLRTSDDLFAILHELGHARDFRDVDLENEDTINETIQNAISSNKEFKKVYNEEKNNFYNAFPDVQRDHIRYFLVDEMVGAENESEHEMIAECNALLCTPKSNELFGIRSQYLQQYFPKTIAILEGILSDKNE